jgi:hypothetical protein
MCDKLRYNYDRTLFAGLTWGQDWFNPHLANKKRNSMKPFIRLLLKTVLSPISDLWHFLKAIWLGIFIFLFVYMMGFEQVFISWLIMFIMYGVIFEITYNLDFKR